MPDSSAFFRRNKKFLWLVVAIFVVAFVGIQLTKVLSGLDSHYGEIAECSYTHEAQEFQTPAPRNLQINQACSTPD